MTRTAVPLCTALIFGLITPAQALTLDLPSAATIAASTETTLASYDLPVGPFADGKMTTRRIEGPMSQTAWQIDAPDQTTLGLLVPLRDQLARAGFSVLFECDAAACGGFDFRYGTTVLPEPEMHVDFGDFRFLSAEKEDEAVSLLVSRSSATGFIQMIHIGGAAGQQPDLSSSTGQIAPLPSGGIGINPDAAPDDIGGSLSAGAAVALDDLVFASGASALSEGVYPSLTALADWLKANPWQRVAVVGHTDASGGLDVNIAVSRKRAESVRQRLIDRYSIPPAQIEAEGVGYLSPRASNLTDAGREKNRRVEAMVTSTQGAP